MPRRTAVIFRLFLCLLLGALTLALSIFAAAWHHARVPQRFSALVLRASDPKPPWYWPPPPSWPALADQISANRTVGYAHGTATSTPEPTAVQSVVVLTHMQEWIGVGWPFYCLEYRFDDESDDQVWATRLKGLLTLSDHRDAFLLNPSWLVQGGTSRAAALIPLTPRWPALLLDLAIFTTLWLSLLVIPQELRRAHRRARGRCLRCGYQLNQLPTCPECGAPSPAPHRPASTP